MEKGIREEGERGEEDTEGGKGGMREGGKERKEGRMELGKERVREG